LGIKVFRLLDSLLVVAIATGLGGCAAREVTPIRMAQPGDESLDCAALNQQIADNRAAVENFVKKDKRVEDGNTAKGIASAMPWVGLLAVASTDLSNEEQVKARALIDRDERLAFLAKQRGCIK
jgi:hypothetical protein